MRSGERISAPGVSRKVGPLSEPAAIKIQKMINPSIARDPARGTESLSFLCAPLSLPALNSDILPLHRGSLEKREINIDESRDASLAESDDYDAPARMGDDTAESGAPVGAGESSATARNLTVASINTDESIHHLDAAPFEPCVFVADFASGSTFRQLIEFLKRVAKELPLVISRHGISTAVCSTSRQITAHAVIRREDLTRFAVDETAVNYPPAAPLGGAPRPAAWYHIVNVDASELFDQISKIGKKDALRIYQTVNEPGELKIRVCIAVKGATQSWVKTVRLRPYTPVSYSITENPRRCTTEPNVTVQLSRFCAAVSVFAKKRSEKSQSTEKIELNLFECGAKLGVTSARSPAAWAPEGIMFGTLDDADVETTPLSRIALSSHTLPALLKLANIAPEGVVRLYASGASLIRAEVPVGCYGTVRIYLSEAVRGRGSSVKPKINFGN